MVFSFYFTLLYFYFYLFFIMVWTIGLKQINGRLIDIADTGLSAAVTTKMRGALVAMIAKISDGRQTEELCSLFSHSFLAFHRNSPAGATIILEQHQLDEETTIQQNITHTERQ